MRRATLAAAPLIAALVAAAWPPGPVQAAGDPVAGRKKARQCAVCHGIDGIAKNPDAPNLAGESPSYLTRQLRAFRDGVRVNEQMSVVAPGLSDADVADLVAWYSSIRVQVTLPP